MSQDLSNQDPFLQATPEDVTRDLIALCKRDSFFLGKAVLGYKDLTTTCHGPIAVFLDENPAQFKLTLIPRDHFKTSLGTITGTWKRVINDPNSRNLIANESSTNAERMLRAIRQGAESNKLLRTLFSDIIPKDPRKDGLRWNDHELDFIRQWVGPEPTIDTIGMTGAFTSRHYTHITVDDPISEEAVKSPKVMEDTIERFKGFLSLLVRPNTDTIHIIGTRWALSDIYSWAIKHLEGRLAVYATGVYTEEGLPIFPELMSLETLELKRRAMGEYKFSCLYLNNPRNEDIQDLNIQDLRRWRWYDATQEKVELFDTDGLSRIVFVRDMDITVCVDLAPAETVNSDMNAITTVGQTPSGDMVVLDAWAKRCKPSEVIDKLFALARRWHPRVFGIEAVAYQKAFKHFLRAECERRMVYLNIRDIKAVGRKETRIRGLQPIMQAGRLYVTGGQQLLQNQMSEFPLGEHDDLVDSLSMHLQVMIGQLSPETIARRQSGVDRAVAHMLEQEEDPIWSELTATKETFNTHIL